jgi:hypothetical protein
MITLVLNNRKLFKTEVNLLNKAYNKNANSK